MADELQIASSALDAVKIIVAAAKKIAGARTTVEEIVERGTHIKLLLSYTRDYLADLEQDYQHVLTPKEYRSLVQPIVLNVQSCNQALDKAFDLRDQHGNLRSEITVTERIKVAARDGRIRKDRDRLETLAEHLHRALDIFQKRLEQIKDRKAKNEAFQNLLMDRDHTAGRSTHRLRGTKDVIDSVFDEDQDSEQVILSGIKNSLKPRGEAHSWPTGLVSPMSSSSILSREGRPSRRTSWLKNFESSSYSWDTSKRSSEPDNKSLLEERKHNEAREVGVESLEALNAVISHARNAAETHFVEQSWHRVVDALSEVIECSDRREILYQVPFTNRSDVHEDLAIVYLKQHKWAEGLREVSQLDLGPPSEDSEQILSTEASYLKSRSYLIGALIYYDRYSKNYLDADGRQMETDESLQDLDDANEFALVALRFLEDFLKNSPAQPDVVPQLKDCFRLLARIYEDSNKQYRAAVYRQRLEILESNSSSFMGPMTRRDTNASEMIDSFDLNDAARREALNPEIAVGNGSVSESLFAYVKNSDKASLSKLVNSSDFNSTLNIRDLDNRSLLSHAVEGGDVEIVHFLLQHDANVSGADDEPQHQPLRVSIKQGQIAIAELLIAEGGDVNTVDENGWSLLHYAIENRSTQTSEFLLSSAPKLRDVRDRYGKTPLHHCAEKGGDEHTLRQAETLLKNGADVNAPVNPSGLPRTPLYLAVSRGYHPEREGMVRLLLRYNAAVEPKALPSRWADYQHLHTNGSKRSARPKSKSGKG